MSQLIPLSEVQPQEEVWRVLYVQYDLGGGLSDRLPRYEVRHSCGEWTPAEGNFCKLCGERIQLPEEILFEIVPRALLVDDYHPEPGSFNNPHRPSRSIQATGNDFNNDPVILERFRALRDRLAHFEPVPRLTSEDDSA